MTLDFVTFGSTAIGMGHIFRCLTLARIALDVRPDLRVRFELQSHPEAINVVRAALPNCEIRVGADQALPEGGGDVVVVDRLQVPPVVMDGLKAGCGCLVSIDDAGPGRWHADIAVSPLYAPRHPRPGGNRTDSLEGVAFSLLDPAIIACRRPRRPRPTSLLLVQGAGDPHGLLPSLVGTLAPVVSGFADLVLHVQTGPSFRNDRALDQALSRCGAPFSRHRCLARPIAIMAEMDLAVTSIGITACELACLGVPTVMVTGEEKELETAQMLAKSGAGIAFGRFDPARGPELADMCRSLLDDPARLGDMSESGRRLVDGLAGERLIRQAMACAEHRLGKRNAPCSR